MARRPKPWFRQQTGCWMVCLGGKQHKLAEGRENRVLAEKRLLELQLLAVEAPESVDARVVTLCEEFLRWSERRLASETYRFYVFYVQSFAEHDGFRAIAELRPFHVTRWVDSKQWNDTTQYNAIRSVLRVFNWAAQEGLIIKNPLKGMNRPKPKSRERALTDSEWRMLLGGARGRFKTFLYALRQTGARPGELRQLTWDQVFDDRCVLRDHKTAGKTGKPRVIYLTPPLRRLMQRLRTRATANHVFLNKRGKPWTTNAVRLQVQRVRRKLNLADDVCAYLIRHTFGTQAILGGVDVAVVAELMGHRGTDMVTKVYGHLAGQHEHLQAALAKAVTVKPRQPRSTRQPRSN